MTYLTTEACLNIASMHTKAMHHIPLFSLYILNFSSYCQHPLGTISITSEKQMFTKTCSTYRHNEYVNKVYYSYFSQLNFKLTAEVKAVTSACGSSSCEPTACVQGCCQGKLNRPSLSCENRTCASDR